MNAKLLLQELWQEKPEWDEHAEFETKWKEIAQNI